MGDIDPRYQGLSSRLTSHLPAKTAVWLGLAVGICIPYFTLQRVPFFPLESVPTTPIDDWITLTPSFIWAYLSVAALVPTPEAMKLGGVKTRLLPTPIGVPNSGASGSPEGPNSGVCVVSLINVKSIFGPV